AALHGGSVLLRQLALGGVVGPSLGSQDQEPIEALPVIDSEAESPGAVRNLARKGLGLRRALRGNVAGVAGGHGLGPFAGEMNQEDVALKLGFLALYH